MNGMKERSGPEEPVLEVRGLRKSFQGKEVLAGIDLEVRGGERLVIMGPSGCGKTTLLSCLIGALKPDAGKVMLFGEDFHALDRKERDRLRLKFGVMFQGGALFSSLTVGENVALPLERHSDLPKETIDILVKLKLNQVGLGKAVDLLPAEISGGMIKRAALARAMALDPRILFCDEPSAGLDPVTVTGIDRLLVDQARTHGTALVVVTHEMTSAFRIADRMIMLYDGRVVAEGAPDSIRRSRDPIVAQFIEGRIEGPIGFSETAEDFAESLLEGTDR